MPTHTIDAGIGTFTAHCPENLKLKMFLDSLKDQIEINGKLDEIIAFVDGGYDEGNKYLKDKVSELEEEVEEKEDKIKELEEELEFENEIGDGIFKIEYNAHSLPVQSVMEELEEAIRKTNPLRVLEHLQSI